MIAENSGRIYRFKLDHALGFGFAEVYDFTDLSMFDGRIIYVYLKHDREAKASYDVEEIQRTGIALGPIRLNQFPNVRGLHAWKFLFQAEHLLIQELPETKELKGLHWKEDNWDDFKGKWYSSENDISEGLPTYVDYERVRHLETRILNSTTGVVKKFTMKVILDRGEKASDYYDLTDTGNRFMFLQLVNTYYPLEKTVEFLKQLPMVSNLQAANTGLPK
jgi:hypothetical protein